MTPHDLFVIGGASLDVLHLSNGQTVRSPGGAGLYTALAAHGAGAKAGMFAPRPDPMPIELQPAADRLTWIGPIVPLDQLPRFEIAHHGSGRATLVDAFWGGEMLIAPETMPVDQLDASIIHIAALRTAERQLNFAKALRMRISEFGIRSRFRNPYSTFRISAGTYGKICASEPDTVRALFDIADYFFMNENEATLIFGGVEQARTKPGHILFVTLSARGAFVVQGDHVTHVEGVPATELDPTGAGDTFCGAALAGLARGEQPIMAARYGVAFAAEMIGAIGPARLTSDQPARLPKDKRVRIVPDQIRHVADLIAHRPDIQPFDFTGELFPPVDDQAALDCFFAATVQQFGFWEMKESNREDAKHAKKDLGNFEPFASLRFYSCPLIAPIDGRSLKGSDYLWAAYLRAMRRDPEFCAPARQAALTEDALAEVFRSDDGSNPMPAFDRHLQQAQAYGRDVQSLGWTPQTLCDWANQSARPRATFLALLDHIGGYKEDPLRKKAMLLALILEQRPERFLRPAADREIASRTDARHDIEPPVIDYHLMRSCLRTGLIEIMDDNLRKKIAGREELSEPDEWAIRFAAYEAIQQVQQSSGCSMGAVDWFFFNARRRCPEMTEPDCPNCAIDPMCAHRKELFQPVRRTTFY